jgi:hypothetical protein
MVLPFTSVTLTFRDVHYYVPAEVRVTKRPACLACCDWGVVRSSISPVSAHPPTATVQHKTMFMRITALLQGGRDLELLKGITGAFRPGVLTALMGEGLSSVLPQRCGGANAATACMNSARPVCAIPMFGASGTRVHSQRLVMWSHRVSVVGRSSGPQCC